MTNPPSVSWSELLGYSVAGGNEDLVRYTYRRGCVNLHMKSCHALSVLRALGANWRVQRWCDQHRSMASCRLSDCTLCQLHEDLEALSREDVELHTPLVTQNRRQWAPEWARAQQVCQQVDTNAAEQLAMNPNQAAQRTYPPHLIFGGLLESRHECTYEVCGRRSRKLDLMTHMSVSYPTGVHATLSRAIAQAQEPETLHRSPCPGCGKDLRRRTMVVEAWPECLVVQLKRWKVGACGRRCLGKCSPGGDKGIGVWWLAFRNRQLRLPTMVDHVFHSHRASPNMCY